MHVNLTNIHRLCIVDCSLVMLVDTEANVAQVENNGQNHAHVANFL